MPVLWSAHVRRPAAVGDGFGVPIVLRYVLEICETAEEAAKVLARVPIHMAYNVTALDRLGHRVTVHLSPTARRR